MKKEGVVYAAKSDSAGKSLGHGGCEITVEAVGCSCDYGTGGECAL